MSSITLYSAMDAVVLNSAPDTNYGASANMLIGERHDIPEIGRALIQFDLSAIPPGATINSATLHLYNFYWYGVTNSCFAYRVTASWDELTATWNNQPAYTTTGGVYTNVSTAGAWYTWNLLAIVQDWIENGQPNYGILMKSGSETVNNTGFYAYTREQSPTYIYLDIDYNDPPRRNFQAVWIA